MPFIPGMSSISAVVGLQAIKNDSAGVGALSPTDQNALYDNDDGGIYTDYMVKNHYEYDPHIYMMPIMSPEGWAGQTSAFVCLAEPASLIWIADWTAERRGLHPKVPATDPGDPNLVLLYYYVDPDMLELMADGESIIYRLSGTYIYGFKKADKNSKMYHGKPPWMDDRGKAQMPVPQQKFVKGIIKT